MLALVEPSLALFCIAMRLGIAIAARMPMITTTIISSINVKPFVSRIMSGPPGCGRRVRDGRGQMHGPYQAAGIPAREKPHRDAGAPGRRRDRNVLQSGGSHCGVGPKLHGDTRCASRPATVRASPRPSFV